MLNDSAVNTYYEKMLKMTNFSAREGQVAFLEAASSVYRHGGVGVIEAGTGTGKSFAYSVSGAVIGRELGKKLIISTANVSLQSQLINKDIPMVVDLVGNEIKTGVAKGKARFICWAKVEKNTHNSQCVDLMALKKNGISLDVDNLPESIDVRAINSVRVSNICKGKACGFYEECEYQQNKEAVKSASIIITNHHYLLTDLAMGGGIILPKLSECLVAIDECHNLPEIAIGAFSEKHLIEKSILEFNNIGMFDANGKFKSEVNNINQSVDHLNGKLNEMNDLLSQSNTLKRDGMIVYKDGIIPAGLVSRKNKISELSKTLSDRIEYLHQLLDDEMSESDNPEIDKLYSNISRGLMESKKVQNVWELFGKNSEDDSPVAKWFKNDEKANDIEVGASITSASESLRKTLIESGAHVVLTSATISDNNSFNTFKKECGISAPTVEVVCKSPFNYQDNATLTIPSMKADPSNVKGHTDEIIEHLPKIIKKGEGTLFLFLSKEQMVNVKNEVIGTVNAQVLVQGELSKKELIKKHCENVDKGITSIIFGLDSFFEGIDLQGKYCSTVGISKLPFPTLNDPVSIVKKHYIESNGGNSFNDMIIPFVIKKLIQGVGRLIRTMSDYGDIYIFDTRMATKGYGKTIMKNLPDMKKNILVKM